MHGYETRFIKQEHASEAVNLYHLARTALAGEKCGRYERLVWSAEQFNKAHPEISRTAAYKDIECLTAP